MLDRLAPPAAGPMAVLHNLTASGNAPSYIAELSKASPPIAVGVMSIAGLPLEAWVFGLTLVYLALQIAYLLWKWRRDVRRDRRTLLQLAQDDREQQDG